MNVNSKGMTCEEFVELMRDRGFTYDKYIGRFRDKHGKIRGKQNRNGYRTLSLNKDHIGYTFCEHRCVWVWCNGAIPDGYEINHIDANRSNNRIENLETVSHSQNMRHAKMLGNLNTPMAEKSGKSIFTNREVLSMRTLHENGWSIKQIQTAFGAKWNITIARYIRKERYGSVEGRMSMDEAKRVLSERGVTI